MSYDLENSQDGLKEISYNFNAKECSEFKYDYTSETYATFKYGIQYPYPMLNAFSFILFSKGKDM